MSLVRRLALAVLGLLLLGSTPGLAKQKVTYMALRLPTHRLENVKTVAILDLSGPAGQKMSEAMVARILDNQRLFKLVEWAEEATPPFLEVVERSRLNAVLGEQNLASELSEGARAAELGGILGVDALVVGTVTAHHNDTHEDRKESYTQNEQTYYKIVRYHTREARVLGTVRVLDAKTGRVITSFDAEATDKATDKEYRNLPPVVVTNHQLAERVGWILADHITPRLYPTEADLLKIRSKDKAVVDLGSQAADLAEAGRIEEAWALLVRARAKDPYNANLLHNLGVMHEVVDDLEEAKTLFDAARQLEPGEKDFEQAQARLQLATEVMKRAEAMGMILAHKGFRAESVASAQNGAASRNVQVRKKTAILYAEPARSSRALVELPRNMELAVLETQGSGTERFFRVKTFDGREGWLCAEDVDLR